MKRYEHMNPSQIDVDDFRVSQFAGEITLRETFISLYIVLIVSLYNFYENY